MSTAAAGHAFDTLVHTSHVCYVLSHLLAAAFWVKCGDFFNQRPAAGGLTPCFFTPKQQPNFFVATCSLRMNHEVYCSAQTADKSCVRLEGQFENRPHLG